MKYGIETRVALGIVAAAVLACGDSRTLPPPELTRVSSPDSEQVNLRRLLPVAGMEYRDASQTTFDARQVAAGSAGSVSSHVRTVTDSVSLYSIVTADGGTITEVHETISSDTTTSVSEVDGETEETTVAAPLEGRTVIHRKQDGAWERSLVGEMPTAEQQIALDDLPGFDEDWLSYPDEPVGVGDHWTVGDAFMRLTLGDDSRGSMTQELVSFESFFGERYAKVAFKVKVGSTATDDDMEWRIAGHKLISLTTGLDSTWEAKGEASSSTVVAENGQEFTITQNATLHMSGRYEIVKSP